MWRTRPLQLSALFFVACMARWLWPTVGPDAWRPRIACDNPVADFGRKQSTEIVPVTFALQNTGFRELHIAKITPGCGCTTIGEIDTPVIPPLGTKDVTAHIKLEGFNGTIRKAVVVESDDPLRPHVVLALQGVVLP